MSPRRVGPQVVLLKLIHDLPLRALVAALLRVLQRRHLLGSIFGRLLLLLGLFQFLDVERVNALEPAEVTKLVGAPTGLLLLRLPLAVEDGVLVVRVAAIGQVGLLFDADLLFAVRVYVFAEGAFGLGSFWSCGVSRPVFARGRVPSLGGVLRYLLVQPSFPSEGAEHAHPLGLREVAVLLVDGRGLALDLLVRLSGLPHVLDVGPEAIDLPLQLLEESFARLVGTLWAAHVEQPCSLVHLGLSLVGLLRDHGLLLVVWIQTPADALVVQLAPAVRGALLSSPALAHIPYLSWRPVSLLTRRIRWPLQLTDFLVKDLVDFAVEFVHILFFRDFGFPEIWRVRILHVLLANHVDLLHDLLVVHLSLELTHLLQFRLLLGLLSTREVISVTFLDARNQILGLDAIRIEEHVSGGAMRHQSLTALGHLQVIFRRFGRLFGSLLLLGGMLVRVLLALVEILMLFDVPHGFQGFLPSLVFPVRNHTQIHLSVALLLVGRLPRICVVLESPDLLVDLLLVA